MRMSIPESWESNRATSELSSVVHPAIGSSVRTLTGEIHHLESPMSEIAVGSI